MCACTMSSPWYSSPAPTYNNYVAETTPPSSSREMRNRAEKMRRDKLNACISELAQLVPIISRSSKKMDKTSILRLAATHLRIYQTLLNGKNNINPQLQFPKINQNILEQLVYEQLNGFLLILTSNGKVIFVSETVENLLGHLQTDLMGQSIYNIISKEDHDVINLHINSDNVLGPEWRKYFSVRMKRAGPRSENAVYETVNFMGMPKSASQSRTSESNSMEIATTSSVTVPNPDVLVFFVRVVRPEPLNERLIEAVKDEYVTRHLVDGRIVNCDQRISFVAGYMCDEVSGLSAFKFMHKDDVRWVMIALRQMYDKGESKGSSCYRLLTRTGQFIYLRTFGFLEIDSTGTVESFICVNTLVDEDEGLRLIRNMKEKYSALIKTSTTMLQNNGNSLPSVEDPQQLEAAIAHLVTNLPSPSPENCSIPSPGSAFESKDCLNTTDHPNSSPVSSSFKVKTVTKRSSAKDSVVTSYKRPKVSPDHTLLHSSPPYQRPKELTMSQMLTAWMEIGNDAGTTTNCTGINCER